MDPETLFKALADATRLRCLYLLLEEKELCVCDLEQAMEMAQPKVSRHLALLRKTRLVKDRKAGQWVHYRINPDLPTWVLGILESFRQGAEEPHRSDLTRVRALAGEDNRCQAGGCCPPVAP